MISVEKYDQLLRFYAGELPAEEMRALEVELKSNSVLADAYENIDLLEKATLQARLFDVENLATSVYQQQVRRTKIRNWTLISAGVILVGLVSFWYAKSSSFQTEIPKKPSQDKNLSTLEVKNGNAVALKEVIIPRNKISISSRYSSKEENKIELAFGEKTEWQQARSEVSVETKTMTNNSAETKEKLEPVIASKTKNENLAPFLGEREAIDPCDANPIVIHLLSNPSCKGEENGAVRALITGGNPPYKEQILDSENRKYASTGLPVGMYSYRVSDLDHCESIQTFEIKAKVCAQHHEFNPYLGKTISFEAQKGKLIIQTQRGEGYFEKELSEVDSFEWDGVSNSGEIRSGLFLYRIEFNGNQTQFGTITLVE